MKKSFSVKSSRLGATSLVSVLYSLASIGVAVAQDAGTTPTRHTDAVPIDVAVDLGLVEETQPRWTEADARELDSIDTESTWATALYIASATSFTGGIVLALAGLGAAGHGDPMGPLVAAGVFGGLSVLLLPFAIGLDVDSGSRRRGLAGEVRARLSLGPTGLTLSGYF